MPKKIKIAKNSVESTLIFPVWGRAACTKYYPNLCCDPISSRLIEQIDYEFTGPQFSKHVAVLYGVRQETLILGALQYMEQHPNATIVNLGCGLDTSFNLIDNGKINWINIDLPEVISFRNKLLPPSLREKNLAYDILDISWLDTIEYDVDDGFYAISGGVLYYLQENAVKELFIAMAKRFKSGAVYFDAENERGIKRSNETVRKSGNSGAPLIFAVNDAQEKFGTWSNDFDYIREEKRFRKSIVKKMPWYYRPLSYMSCFGMMKFIEIGFAK